MITANELDKPHKRYLLFLIESYQCLGGLGDIVGSFDTIDEIRDYIKDSKIIVDRYIGCEVYDRVEGVEVDSKLILTNNA